MAFCFGMCLNAKIHNALLGCVDEMSMTWDECFHAYESIQILKERLKINI